MGNFEFLKEKNKNLYTTISEAEKLFRDEYFSQAMVQTRKFAENLCVELLGDKVSDCETFDLIINKIKDNMGGNIRLNEFVGDLYFIKKNGNESAHSITSTNPKEGENALECLERAFEISIFFMNEKYGYSKKIDSLLFSEELLMTGKTSKPQKNLKERYVQELKKERENNKKEKENKPPKIRKKKTSTNNSTTVAIFLTAFILTLILCLVFCIFLIVVK